jgi:hypothetical protein
MADLLAGRIESLGEQYTAGMGKSVDPINLLDSKARSVMKRLATGYRNEPDQAAPAAAATPTQAAPAGASIPPGAVYLGTHKGRPIYRVNGKNWTP